MDDNSIMPFGKYKNCKLANVPASYLIWLYDNYEYRSDNINEVRKYIEQNMGELRKEASALPNK